MSRLEAARAAFDEHREQRRARMEAAPRSLFDVPADETAQAIVSVARNASEQWMAHAADAIRRAAELHPELTVDEVWPFITEPVHDTRALGAAMQAAARAGILERIPRAWRTSDRPETHSRPLALWRSRLYEGGPDAA